MILKKWDELPEFMRTAEVRPYYESLRKKKPQLLFKRAFDVCTAMLLLVILFIPMLIIAVWIKTDSKGKVFYRQERVTAYGKHFYIHKFRTMVNDADRIGASVTAQNDARITRAGKHLRRLRLDELPQLIDVLQGTMSFVGTRPEAVRYVSRYVPEYYATLLMRAGITSEASVRFKDEDVLLKEAQDIDRTYVEQILPLKMKWNLESIKAFGLLNDAKTMLKTVFAVFGGNKERKSK